LGYPENSNWIGYLAVEPEILSTSLVENSSP
jgi:hypothetical protein